MFLHSVICISFVSLILCLAVCLFSHLVSFFSYFFALCENSLKGHIVVCAVPSASQYNEDQVDKQSFLLSA